MHQFETENGPFALKNFFGKTINIIFMYLLDPFIVEKFALWPKQEFFRKSNSIFLIYQLSSFCILFCEIWRKSLEHLLKKIKFCKTDQERFICYLTAPCKGWNSSQTSDIFWLKRGFVLKKIWKSTEMSVSSKKLKTNWKLKLLYTFPQRPLGVLQCWFPIPEEELSGVWTNSVSYEHFLKYSN